MSEFPHVYTTTVEGTNDVALKLKCESLPVTEVTPPPQFGGPEGTWNPEIFFSASISTCFILTFKAVARAMKLEWVNINVDADAYLDKIDGKMSFTKADIFVTLKVPEGSNEEVYLKALHKAEENCLITNSINSEIHLHPKICN